MKKIYLLAFTLFTAWLPLLAQQESVLHSMRSLPQAHYTNPAITPQQQFYLGLPGISSTYFAFSNSGFNYNSIFERDAENKLYINLPRFQDRLGKKNYISGIAQTDVLSMGVKINARMFLFMNSTLKTYNRFMYPEGLTGLIINGNGANLGESVAFSPAADHISYLENAIGASYIVNHKLTVGATFKQLKGISNIQTVQSDFTLTTDAQTYALQLEGNMHIRTAGIDDLTKAMNNPENIRYSDFQNSGFALDLGATYMVNNRLEVGLSALNLGSINWKNDLREIYTQEASVTFRGINLEEIVNGKSGTEEFVRQLEEELGFNFDDPIAMLDQVEGREPKSYRTGLPTQFYLSARYELARNLHANGLIFSEIYSGRFMPAFSAAINKDFGRRMSTSISYTAANRSYNNLGAGFSFRLTPIQFYLLSDNIISAPIFYKSAKALNLRLGMNMVFGYRKSPSKLPY